MRKQGPKGYSLKKRGVTIIALLLISSAVAPLVLKRHIKPLVSEIHDVEVPKDRPNDAELLALLRMPESRAACEQIRCQQDSSSSTLPHELMLIDQGDAQSSEIAATPEPPTLLMLSTGLLFVVNARACRFRRQYSESEDSGCVSL